MLNRAFSELRYEVLALIAGAAYDGFDDSGSRSRSRLARPDAAAIWRHYRAKSQSHQGRPCPGARIDQTGALPLG